MEVVSAASTGAGGGGGKTSSSDAEIHESKPFSVISNGVLKRHLHTAAKDGVVYKECLKNHAASLGAHAVDGCGEFMPSPGCNPADPTSLKCAACGCHRNFHRQESGDALTTSSSAALMVPNCSPLAIEYQPHNRHRPLPPPPPPPAAVQPPLPQPSHSDPSGSESPPPISSSYYPSAPHLLLTLSGGMSAAAAAAAAHQDLITTTPPGGATRSAPPPGVVVSHSNGRKRFRTRFTQDQKKEMMEFADKLDWKMQRKDESLITEFCNKIGVERGVFKVWMHNNKNYPGTGTSTGKTTTTSVPFPSTTISATTTTTNNGIKIAEQNLGGDKEINDHFQEQQSRHRQDDDSFSSRVVVAPYGSSSSS